MGAVALVAALAAVLHGLTGRPLQPINVEMFSGSYIVVRMICVYVAFNMLAVGLFHLVPVARPHLHMASAATFMVVVFGLRMSGVVFSGVALLIPLLLGSRGVVRMVAFGVWVAVFIFAVPGWLPPFAESAIRGTRGERLQQSLIVGYFFVTLFKRALWAYHDVSKRGLRDWPIVEFFVYMLGMPTLIGAAATPSLSHHLDSRRAAAGPTFRRGVGTVLLCLSYVAAIIYVSTDMKQLMAPLNQEGQLSAFDAWGAWAIILALRLWSFAHRFAKEQMSVGIWRMLGYDLRDDYHRPMLARNVEQFWQRWHMLWREFLVEVYYLPAALWLGRRFGARRPLVYFMAVMYTFGASLLVDAFPIAIFLSWTFPESATQTVLWFALYHLLYGVMVGLSMCLRLRSAQRTAAGVSSPSRVSSGLRWAVAVAVTFVALSYLNILHERLSTPQKVALLQGAIPPNARAASGR